MFPLIDFIFLGTNTATEEVVLAVAVAVAVVVDTVLILWELSMVEGEDS